MSRVLVRVLRYRLLWVLSCVAVTSILGAQESNIPYKSDSYASDGLIFKLIIILVIIALIAYGISYLIKRYYFGGLLEKKGKGDMTLLEVKRFSPQLTVYRIKIDTNEVVLAQSNNGLQVLDKKLHPCERRQWCSAQF